MRREVGHSVVLGLTVALLSVAVPVVRGASCGNCHEPSANRFFTSSDQADPDDEKDIEVTEDVKGIEWNIGRQARTTIGDRLRAARARGDEYWIGIVTQSASEALRSQLKLPEKTGLVVEKVQAGSPAETDGLQPNDILLTAGDKPLGAKDDLDALIHQEDKAPIKFTLLRAGERKEVTVTPQPRTPRKPAENVDGDKALSIKLLRSGQFLGAGQKFHVKMIAQELPDNMTVTIVKHGKEQSQFKVEADGKSWEVTEDKLKDLPVEVRQYVEPMTRAYMLGALAPHIPEDVLIFAPSAPTAPPAPPELPAVPATADIAYRKALAAARSAQLAAQEKLRKLEERYRPSKVLEEEVAPRVEVAVETAKQWSLEKLDTRFDQLQKQLDELRQAVKAARSEAKPAAPPAEAAPPTPPAEATPPVPPTEPASPEAPKTPEA